MLSFSCLYLLPHVVWSAMSSGECRRGIRPYTRTSTSQANLQTGMVQITSSSFLNCDSRSFFKVFFFSNKANGFAKVYCIVSFRSGQKVKRVEWSFRWRRKTNSWKLSKPHKEEIIPFSLSLKYYSGVLDIVVHFLAII